MTRHFDTEMIGKTRKDVLSREISQRFSRCHSCSCQSKGNCERGLVTGEILRNSTSFGCGRSLRPLAKDLRRDNRMR